MLPRTREEKKILKLKLELMAADGKLEYGQYCPEEGFFIAHPPELFMLGGPTEKIPVHLRSTGAAALEAEERCLRGLQINAQTRAASWNNARNSNVL